MSGWWIVGWLAVLLMLCELARRLERTRLDVPMRKPARDCPTCRHVLYADYCDCPERTEP